jgi:hypothetical protein
VDRFDMPKHPTKTRRCRWIAGSALIATIIALPAVPGQTPKPAQAPNAAAPKKDDPLGTYQLVTTVFQPSEKTHLLNAAPAIKVDGGTERAPGEFTGEVTVPAQYSRACDALDRTELTIRDPNTLSYHIVSHGAAVTLNLNVEVHDLLPVSDGSAETPWHARDVIFVAVPKATPAYRFSSEVLVGAWNGEPVVFEVGKDLPDPAKKALEDLGVKQDLGDHVLYSFRVKPPPSR